MSQSYLVIWSNKCVVGGIRRFREELYDGETRESAYACSEHQWGACCFALEDMEHFDVVSRRQTSWITDSVDDKPIRSFLI
jgi:hypothetical protein